MKKIFLLIAATLLFCGQMTAQDIAMATPADISAELNPAYNLQTNWAPASMPRPKDGASHSLSQAA